MASGRHGARGVGVTGQRKAHGPRREVNAALAKDAKDAPETGPAAVLENVLDEQVALALERGLAQELGEKGLGCRVAVEKLRSPPSS